MTAALAVTPLVPLPRVRHRPKSRTHRGAPRPVFIATEVALRERMAAGAWLRYDRRGGCAVGDGGAVVGVAWQLVGALREAGKLAARDICPGLTEFTWVDATDAAQAVVASGAEAGLVRAAGCGHTD